MNKRDKLIIGILEEDLIGIKKVLKDQNKQIKELDKNGFNKDVHPGWYLDIRSGLSYTQGYCNGYINHAEKMTDLLTLEDEKAVLELIKENKRISAENKKHMDEVFKDLKKRIKTKK